MDIWAELWPIPHVNGKTHKSVVRSVSAQISVFATIEDIYHRVVKSGIADDDDVLATTRAIRTVRDNIRKTVEGGRKELTA